MANAGLGWLAIHNEGLPEQITYTSGPLTVYEGSIWELVDEYGRSEHFKSGFIALVPVPDEHPYRKWNVRAKPIYRQILGYIKKHQKEWLAVDDLKKRFPGFDVGKYCSALWVQGYLEKAAEGLFDAAFRYDDEYEPRGTNERPGMFYGVHYRLLKDLDETTTG